MDSRASEPAPLYLGGNLAGYPATCLAGAAAAAAVVSIAAFEVLLGLALVSLLLTKHSWRWPPVTLPVCLWITGTLVSTLASGDVREPQ